jgi:uracil-DNA glycosylase family protein
LDRDAAWTGLRDHALACTRCDLHRLGSRVVFGEGPTDASVALVGEAPGDQEDVQGRPFVGPAGRLLDRALGEAGIERGAVYLTNAVKHFKFQLRGKRRLHQKPDYDEIEACRPWLGQELELLRPAIVVALGATAARGLTGRTVTIGRERGRLRSWGDGSRLLITVHPSFILRVPEAAAQRHEYARLVADLGVVRGAMTGWGAVVGGSRPQGQLL